LGFVTETLSHLFSNTKIRKNMPEHVVVCDGPGDFTQGKKSSA
jgi:hypothetical protein